LILSGGNLKDTRFLDYTKAILDRTKEPQHYMNEDDSVGIEDIREYLGNKYDVVLFSVFYFDSYRISLK
jgi:predicted fused transcriptional regulator/phosphomethylpyrimidine kinase